MPALTVMISAAKAAPAVMNRVVSEGTLLEILETVGEIELEEAIKALRKLNKTGSKKDAVWTAIGHLQTASGAFRRSHSPSSATRRYLGSGWDKALAWNSDVITHITLYFSYMYVKERRLAQDVVDDLELLIFRFSPVDNILEYREFEAGGLGSKMKYASPRRMAKFYEVTGTAYLHPVRTSKVFVREGFAENFNRRESRLNMVNETDALIDFIDAARKRLSRGG